MNPAPVESIKYSIRCRRLDLGSEPKTTITFNLKRETAEIFCHEDGERTLIEERRTTYFPIVLELFYSSLLADVYTHVNMVLRIRLQLQFCRFLVDAIVRTAQEFGHGHWGLHIDVNIEIRNVRFINDQGSTDEEEENEGGKGGTGVSEEVMEMLKRKTSVNGGELERDDNICPICQDNLLTNACEFIKMPCSHIFHDSCIFTWLKTKNTCPVCRQVPFADRSVARR